MDTSHFDTLTKHLSVQNNFSTLCPGLPDRFCYGLPSFGVLCGTDCECCGAVLCIDGFCDGAV